QTTGLAAPYCSVIHLSILPSLALFVHNHSIPVIMGNQSITGETLENFIWLQRYIKGDEVALNYVYRHVYKPLFIYGKKIINDDFVVNTIVQESILNGWKFRE